MIPARRRNFTDQIFTYSANQRLGVLCPCRCLQGPTRLNLHRLSRLRHKIVGPVAWRTSSTLCVTTAGLAAYVSSVVKNGPEIIVALTKFSFMCSRSSGIFVMLKILVTVLQRWLNPTDAQVLMALSVAALHGKSVVNAIQFQGVIQGYTAKILLDSGSSHTFVSANFAPQLQGQSSFTPPLQVKIADGQFLYCSKEFKQLEWSVQHCSFQSSAKVIPLAQYDLIVGMDWLSRFSPMIVDWEHKWLQIPYADSTRMLQGELHELPPGSVVQLTHIFGDSSATPPADLPLEIAQLIQEFQSVFAPPTGYSPSRECEHDIPLLPGATPVSVRPYRYPPVVKDEIEHQIADMLNSGIVQHRQSPFSSSVLLVKKKDGTYCFCVDFRQLNAITVKTKYPVPVIEELLDELHGASWFTSLDLATGYQAIIKSG